MEKFTIQQHRKRLMNLRQHLLKNKFIADITFKVDVIGDQVANTFIQLMIRLINHCQQQQQQMKFHQRIILGYNRKRRFLLDDFLVSKNQNLYSFIQFRHNHFFPMHSFVHKFHQLVLNRLGNVAYVQLKLFVMICNL